MILKHNLVYKMKIQFCSYIEWKKRVDMYLSTLFSEYSRSYIQKLIDKWGVFVNWEQISKNIKIKPKDEIVLTILVESGDNEVLPEDQKLDVIFENCDLLIINKHAWVNVHPVPWEGGKRKTLVNWLLHHCRESLPIINWVERPWIVHRLDKDTSWAIAIAKNDTMMRYLQECFKKRENIEKYYLAIVHGVVKNTEFSVESYIWRDKNNRLKMTTVDPVNPKLARTHGHVLGYIDNAYTLLRVKLETGRTHQIRVHLASIGHFILGDNTYWNPKINTDIRTRFELKRQALHAYELKVRLYWEEKVFRAELKDDMKKMIPEGML